MRTQWGEIINNRRNRKGNKRRGEERMRGIKLHIAIHISISHHLICILIFISLLLLWFYFSLFSGKFLHRPDCQEWCRFVFIYLFSALLACLKFCFIVLYYLFDCFINSYLTPPPPLPVPSPSSTSSLISLSLSPPLLSFFSPPSTSFLLPSLPPPPLHSGKVTAMSGRYHPEATNYSKTKKTTWIADVVRGKTFCLLSCLIIIIIIIIIMYVLFTWLFLCLFCSKFPTLPLIFSPFSIYFPPIILDIKPDLVRCKVFEFDHLIAKAKLGEDENFQDFLNPVTKTEVRKTRIWNENR